MSTTFSSPSSWLLFLPYLLIFPVMHEAPKPPSHKWNRVTLGRLRDRRSPEVALRPRYCLGIYPRKVSVQDLELL